MNKRELCSILQNQTVNPKRLKETQQMCLLCWKSR